MIMAQSDLMRWIVGAAIKIQTSTTLRLFNVRMHKWRHDEEMFLWFQKKNNINWTKCIRKKCSKHVSSLTQIRDANVSFDPFAVICSKFVPVKCLGNWIDISFVRSRLSIMAQRDYRTYVLIQGIFERTAGTNKSSWVSCQQCCSVAGHAGNRVKIKTVGFTFFKFQILP